MKRWISKDNARGGSPGAEMARGKERVGRSDPWLSEQPF